MDAFNVIAGAISIVAFVFAIWEHQNSRNRAALARERVAAQQRKNETALRTAIVGASTLDLIVQRSKQPDVTIAELQNLARSARGILLFLASELEGQSEVLKAWSSSTGFTQSRKPGASPGTEQGPDGEANDAKASDAKEEPENARG